VETAEVEAAREETDAVEAIEVTEEIVVIEEIEEIDAEKVPQSAKIDAKGGATTDTVSVTTETAPVHVDLEKSVIEEMLKPSRHQNPLLTGQLPRYPKDKIAIPTALSGTVGLKLALNSSIPTMHTLRSLNSSISRVMVAQIVSQASRLLSVFIALKIPLGEVGNTPGHD
jgi:hypothetical protein